MNDIFANIVPDEIRAALWEAQDRLSEKTEQAQTIEQKIAQLTNTKARDETLLKDAKAAALDAQVSNAGDADALEAAIAAARKEVTDLQGKVQEGAERIADLKEGLAVTDRICGELAKERDKAVNRVKRVLVHHVKPEQRPGAKPVLDFGTEINMESALMAYMLLSDVTGQGANPFPAEMSPNTFFRALSNYYRTPNRDEVGLMRERVEGLVWGDYDVPDRKLERKPARTKIPAGAPFTG